MDLVQSERGTYSLLVPTMIESILGCERRPDYDLSTLTNIVSGAAMVEASLIERTRTELGSTICNIYGQTEMQGVISAVHRDDSREDQATTIGQPMPRVEVKIADPHSGRVLPLGAQGEICVRGSLVMDGYWKRDDATADALRGGWLHTGDVGRFDEDGYLVLVDRVKDMIIRGGENIYPKEIESVLYQHPSVLEAAVVGRPHEVYGEVPVGYVSLRERAGATVEELLEHARAHLSKYKVPVELTLLESLPKNSVGKIDKPTLRSSFATTV